MEVITNIPVNLSPESIAKHLHIKRDNEPMMRSVEKLIELARPVVNAKAMYQVAYVENKRENSLTINNVEFTSRVLRINLDKVERVFPVAVTCGREIDALKPASNDYMDIFILDAIKEMVLLSAYIYLREHLVSKYALGEISGMAPGSLKDWPVTQQKQLFSVLGNVEELIGVRLEPSFLMTPVKSSSGIYFPTEIRFESCQLCPREKCIGRHAPYNPEMAIKYGVKKPKD